MKVTPVLSPLLMQELHQLGAYLYQLRLKRKITLQELSARLEVNPRTVTKIEKGDPTVSIGTFMKYLNFLGLSRGLATRILGDYLLVIQEQHTKRRFTDDELNF
jgi:transcriptional regulator with XRE-family HTH domain